ncbi:hypothetical protein KO494_02275 [Lacinutrix sp. C3R15]|uniref:hypothetical protein n=1 Tax=Flavobacteriaceae TaxID=49546 RepID=UPI001C09C692|nr:MULTISPECIES: hypothetical protein [Flavobacteriaceae]MBU2938356.1 hypothetical protein [Lacinutrix sp. C3R15]MDO6621671.1 hypothetical protein [Oceanihabitans sp. 1_MG-2023]
MLPLVDPPPPEELAPELPVPPDEEPPLPLHQESNKINALPPLQLQSSVVSNKNVQPPLNTDKILLFNWVLRFSIFIKFSSTGKKEMEYGKSSS